MSKAPAAAPDARESFSESIAALFGEMLDRAVADTGSPFVRSPDATPSRANGVTAGSGAKNGKAVQDDVDDGDDVDESEGNVDPSQVSLLAGLTGLTVDVVSLPVSESSPGGDANTDAPAGDADHVVDRSANTKQEAAAGTLVPDAGIVPIQNAATPDSLPPANTSETADGQEPLASVDKPAGEPRVRPQAAHAADRSFAKALAAFANGDEKQTTQVSQQVAAGQPVRQPDEPTRVGQEAIAVDAAPKASANPRQSSGVDAHQAAIAASSSASGAGASSFDGAFDGQSGSARQEYGRRAFAAAVAVEHQAASAPAQQLSSGEPPLAVAPQVVSGQPQGVQSLEAPAQTSAAPRGADDLDVVPQLVRAMRTQMRDGVGEAQIRLKPEHLGEVRIEIRVEGDRVSALLHVERSDVRQAIESQSHALRSSLAGQGLELDEFTVREDQRADPDAQRRGQQQAPHERQSKRRRETASGFFLDADE